MTAQNSNTSTSSSRPRANVALGYVREQLNGPSMEFLKLPIEAECKKRGWELELYQDHGAHAHGSHSDRPGLLALKQRAEDTSVVAILVCDLSQLHRCPRTVAELINQLAENHIQLVVMTSTRVLEISTPYHVMAAG